MYYPGLEDDFIRNLPEAIIDRIRVSEPVICDDADSLASVSSSTLVHELHRRIRQGDDDYIAMSVWLKDDVQIRIDVADENPYAISADDVIKSGFLKELGAATDHDWKIIQDAIQKTREQERRYIRESAENTSVWSDPDGVYANIDISEDRYVTVKMPIPISRESDGAPYAYVMQAENGREVMVKGTGNGVCSLEEAGLSEGELVDMVRDKLFVRADRIMWQKQKNDHTDSE